MESITARHRRFVEAYTGEEMGNGAAAARAAGYSETRARHTAYELLQDGDIQAMIEERLDRLSMSSAEALKRMTDIARASIGDYMEVVGGRLVVDVDAVQESGALIKRLKVDDDGVVTSIELYSAQDALKTIMDAHGAFNHRQEIDHTIGEDLTIEVIGDPVDIQPPPPVDTDA